ncbi:bacteriohemerythrin [Tissierella sp.]|uniref:bacteriohemerythrin n=1 Tax=Tissierella sp. TaxID=41274 RepID=UPI0028ACE1DC|nr:bacteriohemerythrin [Tissierella sp.]
MLWWTDELETGIDSIDKQHKSIFDKASEIFSLGVNSDIKEVEKIFIFLMGYANNHFYEEEILMMEDSYKDFIEHRRQHNYFIEKIYRIYQNTIEGQVSEENLNDLKVLIIEWLANHINIEDKKYIKLMKGIQ